MKTNAINTQNIFFEMLPVLKKNKYINEPAGITISAIGTQLDEINIGSEIKIIMQAMNNSVGIKVRYFAVNLLQSK